MKNKYVCYELDREVSLVLHSIRKIEQISKAYKMPGISIADKDTLLDLKDSASRILAFVNHVEALQQVLELPDNQ
jgi:hypothetical protein